MIRPSRLACVKWMAAAALTALGVGALAQDAYPTRSIRLVVGLQAGGTTDLVARLVAAELARALKQPVVVDNLPGAAGVIANQALVRSPPDGYTIQLGTTSTNVIAPLLQAGGNSRPAGETMPVGLIGVAPLVLFVNPKAGVDTALGLVELSKRAPGKLNYGSAGLGSTSHLAGELFKLNFGGLDVAHIPYKGGTAMDQAVMTGEVTFAFDAPGGIVELQKAGRVKALAIMSERRNEVMPDTPTAREAGLGDLTAVISYFVFVPSQTPGKVIDVLEATLKKIKAQPEFQRELARYGLDPDAKGSDVAAAYLEREFERWRDVIVKQNIKLN